MKLAVINFSGNVGKTTVAKQLLAPRMPGAAEFAVETLNAGASEAHAGVEQLKGKDFGNLVDELLLLDHAIVDIGASNVEEFVQLMGQFDGSHEEFDFYLVPTVSEKKQQVDTINTIETLFALGVPSDKIRVIFNKVPLDDTNEIQLRFPLVCGYHAEHKRFRLNTHAAIVQNEIFERLRALRKSVSEVVADQTDYKAQLRTAKDEAARLQAVGMVAAQRLAKSANRNLDEVFKAVFR